MRTKVAAAAKRSHKPQYTRLFLSNHKPIRRLGDAAMRVVNAIIDLNGEINEVEKLLHADICVVPKGRSERKG